MIGTLKSQPIRAIKKSVPPKGRPKYSDCTICFARLKRTSYRVPSGRDGAAPKLKIRLSMTDTDKTKTVTFRMPSHFAYNVCNREGGDNYWTRIGSAWTHADNSGFNIQLETIPLDGRIRFGNP